MKRYAVPYHYVDYENVESTSYVEIIEAESPEEAKSKVYDMIKEYELAQARVDHFDIELLPEELEELILPINYDGDKMEGDEGFFIGDTTEIKAIRKRK